MARAKIAKRKITYRARSSKPLTAAEKMRAYRARKKKAGYKLAQIWVADLDNMPANAAPPPKPSKRASAASARHRPGYKLVQMWVLDLDDPKIRRELRRQLKAIAGSPDEQEALAFIEATADFSGWK
jgi:hypothetical protein